MILFPDTNFFLHFRDASDIPWAEVTSDDHVRLVVCRNTQKEIDKKKFELRGRAQQRARKYHSLIGRLLFNEAPVVLREAEPRVTLELCLDRPPGWTPPGGLDTSAPGDDSFVADVLAYREATGIGECFLMSADTGPLGTAKRYAVPILSLIGRDWELEEETDTRDKQINRLTKELEELRRGGPVIAARASADGKQVESIQIEVVRYPALPEARVAELLEKLQRLHPRVLEFPRPAEEERRPERPGEAKGFDLARLEGPYDWVGPTEEQIAAYGRAYEAWVAEARRLIETLPGTLQRQEFEATFELALANVGVEPATDVLVSFEATSGLLLRNDDDNDEKGKDPVPPATEKPPTLRSPPGSASLEEGLPPDRAAPATDHPPPARKGHHRRGDEASFVRRTGRGRRLARRGAEIR